MTRRCLVSAPIPSTTHLNLGRVDDEAADVLPPVLVRSEGNGQRGPAARRSRRVDAGRRQRLLLPRELEEACRGRDGQLGRRLEREVGDEGEAHGAAVGREGVRQCEARAARRVEARRVHVDLR